MAKNFIDFIMDTRDDLRLIEQLLDGCRQAEQEPDPNQRPKKLQDWFSRNHYGGVTEAECGNILAHRAAQVALAGNPDAY